MEFWIAKALLALVAAVVPLGGFVMEGGHMPFHSNSLTIRGRGHGNDCLGTKSRLSPFAECISVYNETGGIEIESALLEGVKLRAGEHSLTFDPCRCRFILMKRKGMRVLDLFASDFPEKQSPHVVFRTQPYVAAMATIIRGGFAPVYHNNVGEGLSAVSDSEVGNFHRDIRTQLPDSSPTGFPKGRDEQGGSNKAKHYRPQAIFGGVSRGINRLPLSAKIGLSIILIAVATPITFAGYANAGELVAAYRRRGLGQLALGFALFGAAFFVWSFISPY